MTFPLAELEFAPKVAGHRQRWSDDEILNALRQAELEGEAASEPLPLWCRKPCIGTIERRFLAAQARASTHQGMAATMFQISQPARRYAHFSSQWSTLNLTHASIEATVRK